MSGQTIAEKVLSAHCSDREAVRPGDIIDVSVDGVMTCFYHQIAGSYKRIGYPDGPPRVFDPDRIYVVNDHNQPARNFLTARSNYDSKRAVERLGIKHYCSEMGIGHQMMLDYGLVCPGELVVGNDSHTISYGGLNVVSTGIGHDETAFVWAFGELYFVVPPTIKVVLKGHARAYPFGKDIMLYLAGKYSDSFAQNRSLEFTGEFARDSDISSRVTLADHAVEVGATFGLFDADEKTGAYLEDRAVRSYTPVAADSDAAYEREIVVDCDDLEFQVAKPYRFDNVVPVSDAAGTRIDQARIGSCANGRYEDIEVAARMLDGRHVADGVKLCISPASMTVYKQCVDSGVMGRLLEAGASFQQPGCGICTSQVLLNEEVCISSTTRNYHGRFGGVESSDAQIYLASPATVAAAAIAGEITDPKELLK